MIRPDAVHVDLRDRWPRTSGDDPEAPAKLELTDELAPHERG